MKFLPTQFSGVFLLEPELIEDERGFFTRLFCDTELKTQGTDFNIRQCNLSFNKKRGTLRGMHYQEEPYSEAKIVRCTRGSIFDVIIDLRPEAPTYLEWDSFELTAENRRALLIPKRFAHGFQALEDNTEVFYEMSEVYMQGSARGIRWNDEQFSINWPVSDKIVSVRDQQYLNF